MERIFQESAWKKSPQVTDKPITKIINNQQDIKLGQFTHELNVVPTKIKNKRTFAPDEIPPEVWKTRKFDDTLLQYCNTLCKQNTIDGWTKCCTLPFHKKSDLGIAKNY